MTKKILMVCLGNICRSPIAEAVMNQVLEREKLHHEWSVDSAGLGGWHSGSLPDERALSVLKQNGIVYVNRARVITIEDYKDCDYIFGMDNSNVAELKRRAPDNSKAKIKLLGDFGLEASDKIIVDPYYLVGEEAFVKVYKQCLLACTAFAEHLKKQKGNTLF
uniref:Low molecular weight phosphotyrosine protein phosphatase n=1 Tax=Glossina brevipalpis TaxID=37001 RepID=A0A1A9WDJ8_9MUSC